MALFQLYRARNTNFRTTCADATGHAADCRHYLYLAASATGREFRATSLLPAPSPLIMRVYASRRKIPCSAWPFPRPKESSIEGHTPSPNALRLLRVPRHIADHLMLCSRDSQNILSTIRVHFTLIMPSPSPRRPSNDFYLISVTEFERPL